MQNARMGGGSARWIVSPEVNVPSEGGRAAGLSHCLGVQ